MISIKFRHDDDRPGRLARAEIHFLEGELQGLKLTGFSVWADRVVTFPGSNSRAKSGVHGLALLRPISDAAQPTLAQEILDAYDEFAKASGR